VTLIEAMPLGKIDEDRFDQYIPLSAVRANLEENFTFLADTYRTGGPSQYWHVEQTGGRIGFITPLSNNFCAGCNRVRLTCTGKLFLCLGQNDDADLRKVLRSGGNLDEALTEAMMRKPKAHDFRIDAPGEAPAVSRHMLDIELPKSVTDKPSLTAYLSSILPGFAELAALPDTRISVNMMVSMNQVDVGNEDEIAYMSALSGG